MMPFPRLSSLLAATMLAALPLSGAAAQQAEAPAQASWWGWFEGQWSLTLGGAGYIAPEYEGADTYSAFPQLLISLGRTSSLTRFASRNDSASFAVIDNGVFRFGPAGRIVFPRDDSDSNDLRGLEDVPWGVELGAFVDVYPVDWARLRGEVRQGIHAYNGTVFDLAADAFYDVTPTIRVSGGPRLSLATQGYFDAYYGVTAAESARSGLAEFDPDGGLRSAGVGGAITWRTTDKVTTSLFAEYKRLLGDAADSSLVEERGSANQFQVGVSATYRFDFAM